MRTILRVLGRLTIVTLALGVAAVIAIQSERVVARNVALSRELSATRTLIAALRAKRHKQERLIRRLSDPRGTVPEIHDRLRMVGPREDLIYVKGGPSPAPRWEEAP